ncbi:hypothetical protein [Spirillospora sp. NPDC029432]|uniref:hypothetical protein n=1 Tax=Spirillospora sp. NPDC029432 TaxID=3154599 RepID=UPI003455965B
MTGRHAYRPPEPAEEDPFERTRPDPAGEEPAREEAEERRQVLSPRDRRVLEAIALITLVPVLLSLRWIVDDNLADRVAQDRPEKVTTVPRGTVATWNDVRWRLYAQSVAGPPLGQGPEVAELRLAVAVKPMNDAGAKLLTSYGLGYRVTDAEGHVWTGRGSTLTPPRPGAATKLTVTVALPRSKANSVALEVRPPEQPRQKGPLPLLRFAR